MIITFILPSPGNVPIGGFKIIYEYANRMYEKGYKVNIVHAFRKKMTNNPLKMLYRNLSFKQTLKNNSFLPDSWFKLNKNINSFLVPYIIDEYMPDADFVFATEYTTAEPVFKLSASKGRKMYFIQSLETWLGPEKKVIETWILPLTKIVISKWLLNYAHQINQKVWYIPNGLDFDKFSIDVPVLERNPVNVLMLFHSDKVKGSEFGLRALIEFKKEMPNLNVTFFSVTPKSAHIPNWINYIYKPTQEHLRRLYNNSAIFISPSLFEGFPLPPAEAMMCGSAIIATDIGGHREYCIDNETALLVKPKSEEDIYRRTKELINNASLRIKIAKNGNKFIKQFTWNDAINKMEEILALQL